MGKDTWMHMYMHTRRLKHHTHTRMCIYIYRNGNTIVKNHSLIKETGKYDNILFKNKF